MPRRAMQRVTLIPERPRDSLEASDSDLEACMVRREERKTLVEVRIRKTRQMQGRSTCPLAKVLFNKYEWSFGLVQIRV